MSGNPSPTPVSKRQQEASKWLAKLERGMRDDEGRDLQEWLKDKANREVILEGADLWHSPDVHSLLCTLMDVPVRSAQVSPPPKKQSLMLPVSMAVISTLALLSIFFTGRVPFAGTSGERTIPLPGGRIYQTAVGETREETLEDGSTLTLNTGTRVNVYFSNRERQLTLLRGEASFHSTPDPTRPFEVSAGRRTFQSANARFNLRVLTGEIAELTVVEGHVKVMDAPPRMPDTPARRRESITFGEETLNAFEEALVEPGFQQVHPIAPDDLNARLAWQQGLIVIDDKALQDAIAEVERYTLTRFVLADEKLGALRVSGRFRTGNVNAVRLALRQNFLVVSRRDTRGRIVLSPLKSG